MLLILKQFSVCFYFYLCCPPDFNFIEIDLSAPKNKKRNCFVIDPVASKIQLESSQNILEDLFR